MQNIKKYLAIALFAAVTVTMTEGCKKGPGDPFLSLRSRKSRVAGEWNVDEYNVSTTGSTTSNNGISNYSKSLTVKGSNVNFSSDTTSFGNKKSFNQAGTVGKFTINFDKNGTFTMVQEFQALTSTEVDTFFAVVQTTKTVENTTTTTSGTWNFLGGVEEDYKNKERIILNTLKEESTSNSTETRTFSNNSNSTVITGQSSSTTNFGNGENSMILEIYTLKNKEMIMTGTFESSGNSSETHTSGGSTSVNTKNFNETGKVDITLSHQ